MSIRGKKSKVFAMILCVAMLLGTATMVHAYPMNEFGYQSHYPGYPNKTDVVKKNDNSSAVAYYISGPADKMYAEMWGGNATSGDEANYTVSHLEDGQYVKYYVIKKGEQEEILNLVYETYKGKANTVLKTKVYGTGYVTGSWSPTTR